MLERAILSIIVAMVSWSAAAETKTFVGLRLSCNAGSTLSVAKTADPIYYEFSGDLNGKPYTVCNRAGGAWGGRHGSASANLFERCETFVVAPYALACSGGAVQGIPLSLAIREMRRATGQRGLTEAYPVQANAILIPVWGPERTVMAPLPAGHGIVEDLNAYRADPVGIIWDDERGIPFVPVLGSLPTVLPRVEPVAWWVRLLAAVAPWAQLIVAAGLIAFAVVAHAGYRRELGNPDEARKLRLIAVACIAILGITLSAAPAAMPQSALDGAMAQLNSARAQAATIERDRAALATFFRTSNGTVQPVTESDMQRLKALTQLHRIDPVEISQPNPELWAALSLIPTGILLLFYSPRFLVGWDWFRREHPAEKIVMPAVRQTRAIDANKLADALTPDIRDLELHSPSYRFRHDAEKARALKDKLDADAALAEAAMRREQKQAELRRKRVEIAKLERELGD
jgi:hypothetical protein